MTRSRPDELEFVDGRREAVVVRMAAMAAEGTGWLNVRPVIEPQHEPEPPGVFAIFGGSPHKIPLATWIPGRVRDDSTPTMTAVGLQHASGPRVARRLAEAGAPLPDGWKVTQDHPRRGLVAHIPPGDEDAVLAWLVRASRLVSAVPVTGRWHAWIHTRLP